MKQFYLHDGTSQQGPFDISELRQKGISTQTLIWFNGLADWTEAGKLDDLKDLFQIVPPPFMSKSSTTSKSSIPVNHSNTATSRTVSTRKIFIFSCLVVAVLVSIYLYKQIEKQDYEAARQQIVNNEEDIKKRIRENITSYVKAERSAYQYSNLGGIYNLQISVSNSSNYILDNVRVKIVYIKASGGIWHTRYEDFNMINANTKVTHRIPDMERGIKIEYEIVSIKSNVLGLF